MGYRVNTRNNGVKIVNRRDEILQLLRDGQIGPNTQILDIELNLELMVSDVLSPRELKDYYGAANSSFPNSRPFENANLYNQMEQNDKLTIGKSKSGKLKRVGFITLSILLLLTGLIISIPRLAETMKINNQKNAAKELVKHHFDNLLGHREPKILEISYEEYGKDYKLLQKLNDSYNDFYKTFEKYLDLSKGIDEKDYEKSQKNTNDILPVISDCSKKYIIFVSRLETAADKYNVEIMKVGKNVDNYTERARSLTLEYYNSSQKLYETIIRLRELLEGKKGTYRKVGTVYFFENEADKNEFNALVAQYNDYIQKKADSSTKMKFLKEGVDIDIVRK